MSKNRLPTQQPNPPKQQFAQFTASTSPAPSPDLLIQYREVQADFPERLMVMTEREQGHRHDLNNKQLDDIRQIQMAEIRTNRRGQFFAILGVLLIGSLSGYIVYCGYPTQATTLATTTIVALVIAFLKGADKKATLNINHNNNLPEKA